MSKGNTITIKQLMAGLEAAKREANKRVHASAVAGHAAKFGEVETALAEAKDALTAACKADATFTTFEVETTIA